MLSDSPTSRAVMSLLHSDGSIDKCVLCASLVYFFGNRITTERILPIPEKVSALKDYRIPTNIKEMISYLGQNIYPINSKMVSPAGSVQKSRGDNMVRMWEQLNR